MLTQTAIGIRTPNTSRTCASELSKNRATCNCSKSTHLRVYWRTTPCLAHKNGKSPTKTKLQQSTHCNILRRNHRTKKKFASVRFNFQRYDALNNETHTEKAPKLDHLCVVRMRWRIAARCRVFALRQFCFFYSLISFGTGSLFCSDVTFALGIFLGFYGRLGHGLCLDIGILINPCHDKGSHFLNHVPRSLPACFTALFLGPFTCPRPPRVG